MTDSALGLRRSSRALPRVKLAPKKRLMVTVWWSAGCWLSDPLQLSESQRNHYICEVCSAHWWDAPKTATSAAGILLHDNAWLHVTHPMLQKLNELGYEVLPQTPYSPNLSPTDCHFYKHLNNFLQEKCFHNQQEAQNAFQEFYSGGMNCYATGINKRICHWQKCVDCNGSYFD